MALADFDMERANSLGPASWPRLWAGREADADALQPGLADAIAGDLVAIAEAKPQSLGLPRGTIHADLFPDNAFFLGDTFPAPSTSTSPAPMRSPTTLPSASMPGRSKMAAALRSTLIFPRARP
jgi:hypothetical protein